LFVKVEKKVENGKTASLKEARAKILWIGFGCWVLGARYWVLVTDDLQFLQRSGLGSLSEAVFAAFLRVKDGSGKPTARRNDAART